MSAQISFKDDASETERHDSMSRVENSEYHPSTHSLTGLLSSFQQRVGNRALYELFKSGVIQAKLKICPPHDICEEEAERVAEELMNDKDSVRPTRRSPAKTVSRQGEERGEKTGNKPNEPKEEEKSSYGEKEAPTWAVPMKYRIFFSDEIQSFVDVTTNRTYSKSEMDRLLGDAEDEKKFCEKLIPVLEKKLADLENLPPLELEEKEGVEIVNQAVYEVLQMCVELKGEWVGGYTNWGDPYSERFCAVSISDKGNPFLVFPFWQHERVHQRECLRAIDERKSKFGSLLETKVAAAGKLAGAKVFVASEIEAYRTAVSEIQHEVETYRSGDYGKSGIAPVCAPETFSIHKREDGGGPAQGANEMGAEKGGNSEATTGLESRIREMQGNGRPLSESVRSYFEPRFASDFSDVRVHTGEEATESARAINAKAFTFGNHIVFDQAEYSPDSESGQRLLAHELTHVVQQNGADVSTPSSAQKIMREEAAEQVSTQLPQRIETAHVSGAYTTGSAPQPRSLTQSLNPLQLSDDELLNEIMLIKQWLQKNPAPGSERNQLMLTLSALELHAGTRKLAGYTRQYGFITETATAALPGGKISIEFGRLAAGFSSGFLQGAILSIPEHSYRDLATELNLPENTAFFDLGVLSGIPVGALKDLKDNVVGLAELALYTSPFYQMYRSVKAGLEFLEAPTRTIERDLEIAKGVMEFLYALETDPAFLLTQGEALGVHCGGESGYWFSTEFMAMSPFMKGFVVGDKIGYVAFEIVLLFLPLEWLIKGTQASRVALAGSKLGKTLLKVLERAPGISRIIKAHRVFEEARAVEKAAEGAKVIEKSVESGTAVTKAADVEKAAAPIVETKKVVVPTPEAEKAAEQSVKAEKISATGKTAPETAAFKEEALKPTKVPEKIEALRGNLDQIEQKLMEKNAERLKAEAEVTARYRELESARRKTERFPEKRAEFEKMIEAAEERYEDAATKKMNLDEEISKLQAEKAKISKEIYRAEKGIQYPIDSTTRSVLERHGFKDYDEVTGIATKENGLIKIQKTEKGWKCTKDDMVISEYDIAIYKNQPGTDSFFEAHHAIQDEWAERKLVEFGYNSDEAPSILLRDKYSGTPHRMISDRQIERFKNIEKRTYMDERKFLLEDMQKIGVPPEIQNKMMNEVDGYFRKLRDTIKDPSVRKEIFGAWEG
jgi:antitoxin component HigA of HigAB toxin-antitoxin module